MKSKRRSAEDKISTAIQAYIDAYDRCPRDTQAADVFLSLPMQIQCILMGNVPAEDLVDIHIAAIEKRRRVVTVH
jgi:hypothetical protein